MRESPTLQHIPCLRIYTYTGILFSISGYPSQHTPAGLLLTCHDVKAGILKLHSLLELHTLEVQNPAEGGTTTTIGQRLPMVALLTYSNTNGSRY